MYVKCTRCGDVIYQQGEADRERDEMFCANCKETTVFEAAGGA